MGKNRDFRPKKVFPLSAFPLSCPETLVSQRIQGTGLFPRVSQNQLIHNRFLKSSYQQNQNRDTGNGKPFPVSFVGYVLVWVGISWLRVRVVSDSNSEFFSNLLRSKTLFLSLSEDIMLNHLRYFVEGLYLIFIILNFNNFSIKIPC